MARTMKLKKYICTSCDDKYWDILERMGTIVARNCTSRVIYGIKLKSRDIIIGEYGIRYLPKIKAELLK